MNIYKSLNEIIEYIEQNLENKIDYNDLAKILGVNEYTMQRIFSLLCNISISEYIRKRRLSNAGFDLYHSNEKLIDIAIKYQYDNPTSFSRAFEKFHGIKPSMVKLNFEKLNIFTKIIFDEKIVEQKNIEYSIITLNEFILYGKGIKTSISSISKDAPEYFTRFNNTYSDKYGHPHYGMTVYEKRFESCNLEYWILYNKKIENFKEYHFPKSKWISLKVSSQEAIYIQNTINSFYTEFLPSSKYNLKNLPELEYYHDDITEILIPIED